MFLTEAAIPRACYARRQVLDTEINNRGKDPGEQKRRKKKDLVAP